MKKIILNILLITVLLPSLAQKTKIAEHVLNQRGEIYIKFTPHKKTDYQYLGNNISIDKILKSSNKKEVYAYLNNKQFEWLQKENIDFELLTAPSMLKAATMCADQNSVKGWDCYPTYSQYVAVMESFVSDYPALCKLEEFGQSINDRKLLVLKISDNVGTKEEEPEFFYTATMHGDETTGYVLMLRFIDYLLTNYGTDLRVTDLVDNTEIWINPLSNPDGTFAAGDNDITGATRANSNGIDLNRNYPDPDAGEHPDGNDWQHENIEMMDFMATHNFVLAANLHGGAEVVNYPWDAWYTYEKTHADHDWYQGISQEYADTVHANSSDYMVTLDGSSNPSGITHGASWYSITGGRQDYMNYYLHGREVTLEISNYKTPSASTLPLYWNYNFRSFLNYIGKVHTGIYGKVTDQDGNLVHAKITLKDYDKDSSEVYTDPLTGMYYRMVLGGDYTIEASAPNHDPAEYEISAITDSRVELNFVLQRHATGIDKIEPSSIKVVRFQNPVTNLLNLEIEVDRATLYNLNLFDLSGRIIKSKEFEGKKGLNNLAMDITDIESGVYICKIHSKLGSKELKVVKVK